MHTATPPKRTETVNSSHFLHIHTFLCQAFVQFQHVPTASRLRVEGGDVVHHEASRQGPHRSQGLQGPGHVARPGRVAAWDAWVAAGMGGTTAPAKEEGDEKETGEAA